MATCGNCGEEGHNVRTCTGYAEYYCRGCGNRFRINGNGGLRFGMFPSCEDCGSHVEVVEQG